MLKAPLCELEKKKSKFFDFGSPVTLPGASLWHFCQKPSWHESRFLIQPRVASRTQEFFA